MTAVSLVTGGGGFVGRHLIAALARRGETVRALDLRYVGDLPRCEAIVGSVTDRGAVAEACRGATSVFHCAAVPHLWSRRRSVFSEVNVEGTRIVAELAAEAGAQRMVHVSSAVTVTGRRTAGRVVDETLSLDRGDMLGPYPLSKLESEEVARGANRAGFATVIVMPSAPIGAGDHGMTPPTRFLRDLVNRRVPAVIDGVMNFIDVRALAEGIVLARDRGRAGERYLLAGENLSMTQFLALVETASGVPMPRRRIPAALALAFAMVDETVLAPVSGRSPRAPLSGVRLAATGTGFDSSKARAELGFDPPPLVDAVAAAVRWLSEQGLVRRHPA